MRFTNSLTKTEKQNLAYLQDKDLASEADLTNPPDISEKEVRKTIKPLKIT